IMVTAAATFGQCSLHGLMVTARLHVDGVYGPATVEAVQALQKANGLPQTGTVDKATEKALG
ncbi:MAG: peptidoglycan-binding domain-containing protein, partial [Dermatophilaceae bacterium]